MMKDHTNPYLPPIQASRAMPVPFTAKAIDRPAVWTIATACLIGVQLLVILAGVAVAFVEIESIIFSGPILTILGLLILAGSLATRCWPGMCFALSNFVIAVVCFGLINLLEWSPAEAQRPISLIALTYGIAVFPLGLLSVFLLARPRYLQRGNAPYT